MAAWLLAHQSHNSSQPSDQFPTPHFPLSGKSPIGLSLAQAKALLWARGHPAPDSAPKLLATQKFSKSNIFVGLCLYSRKS